MKSIPGVVIGIVKQVQAGQVKLEFPWLNASYRTDWVPIATPMSGGKRGFFFMPEPEDEVLVAFEHGELDHPFVIGCLWNGVDGPPSNDVHLRSIHSVNGHEVAIYDPEGSGGDRGYVRIEDAYGNVIKLSNALITIQGIGAINIQSIAAITIQAPAVIINGRTVLPGVMPI